MNNNPDLSSSWLELCPDEILLEIFTYLEPIDLLSFLGHNKRMNNIIQDVKLKIVVPYSEDENDEKFSYLRNFHPNQLIYLDVHYRWNAFNLYEYTQLRSLKFDCNYLQENQFDQLLTVNLPHLERFSIDNVPHYYGQALLLSILDKEHCPSLTYCRFSGEFYYMLELGEHCQSPSTTIHTFIINRWDAENLYRLVNLLPNLHRLETNLTESIKEISKFHFNCTFLDDLRINLHDPSNDLEKILQYMPNLRQLRVKGKISENSILEHFEKLAKILCNYIHGLRKFNCELYFNAWIDQVDIDVIRQLHPLFKSIQCYSGKFINRCYATDLTEYPLFNEYSDTEKTIENNSFYSGLMNEYDSDHYHNDDNDEYESNDGWIDYGFGYRGNDMANYGSSPWSENNAD